MPRRHNMPVPGHSGPGQTSAKNAPDAEGRYEVTLEHRRLSVFDFLDAVLGPVDRKLVMAAARSASVQLNGEPTSAGAHVTEGDTLTLSIEPEALRRQIPGQLPILFRDQDLIVGDKPSGLPFDAGRRGGDSALERMAAEMPGGRRPRPVHRLDKQTSGLMLTALSDTAERALDAALRTPDYWVEYTAVIRGTPAQESGSIDLALGKSNKAAVRLQPDPERGTPSTTRWWTEERLRGYTVLRLRQDGVGRSHYIRAHLAALGHPAMGDALYGEDDRLMLSQLKMGYRPKRGRPERPVLSRPALHCSAALLPPVEAGGEPRQIRSPLPRDLTVLLSQLRRLFPLA